MQRIIVLNNPRIAQAFIDYMASRGIKLDMAAESEGIAIWLSDDQYLVEVKAELEQFLAKPYDKKYQAASWDLAESRTAKFNYGDQKLTKMVTSQAGPFTIFILIAAFGIYGLWWLGFADPIFSALHFPSLAEQKWQVWRLFTHSLLHFSLMHIVFNGLWWWFLGGKIEQQLGSSKLIQLFLLSSLISGFAQYWISGVNFGGLSGVVYALMGYMWLLGKRAPERGIFLPNAYAGFMLFWLVFGFMQPLDYSFANMAHLGGLVTGCLIALFDSVRHQKNKIN
ncbi:rhomboid family intramembrane serine protease GlpG [Vibrio sp. SS-MA-C1-2]|uniref:rhomboid family intramembrane serine protease GlpG n=1 Tax=Vibrio sp. SS-MA-C1-2 TaxID=2908646 RepID=UPI001F183286|nr:rhomboid family intramembrane serine protease GlpG [Vibrio sp. SS-MA-C1-2]UJF19292.1 rhomboid family intramembrane serine protease GlpG [Vibrio sp. SS-MA-C1-2]